MSTPQYKDLWPLIQQDILGAISADEFCGTRTGVLVEPGDITSNIQTKLAKVVGAGVDGRAGVGFLMLPIEKAEDEDISSPFSPLKLAIIIDWVENVTINRATGGTGIPIRIYAARTAKLLKLYTPVGLTQSLVSANPVISEFTEPTNQALRIGRVEFSVREADSMPLLRVNRPQIIVDGTGYPYTVTVNAAGADTVFYTLDGSHPWERNAQATPYTQPVTVTECCLLRVRAFKAGVQNIGSDTAAYLFT